MADRKTINSILNNLRSYQKKLQLLSALSRNEFVDDFTNIESAKHLLQVSIQSCIDLAQHIVASEGYRTPNDSFDSFVILNEEEIIPDEILLKLRPMVSFRNRVVHLYWDVDDSFVYEILRQNLIDFENFASYIIEFASE